MSLAQRLDRLRYYSRHLGLMLFPGPARRALLRDVERLRDDAEVRERLAYYVRLPGPFAIGSEARPFRLDLFAGQSTYQLDLLEILRAFPPDLRVHAIFGDNIHEPVQPALVKSRPISAGTTRAVLFKLNQVRHFTFVRDDLPFEAKSNSLVWRGNACQPHRIAFLERFLHHPRCDVGHFHRRHDPANPLARPELSIAQQLRHKFILAMEGNDVATNLKWALSSNSLCLMTRPRYETWFMEGKLEPGVHYVELAPDYANLDEVMERYSRDVDAAHHILRNAHAWVDRFRDLPRERVIQWRVLEAYFRLSNQLGCAPDQT